MDIYGRRCYHPIAAVITAAVKELQVWPLSWLKDRCHHFCRHHNVTVEGRGVVTELNHEMDSINKWKGYREGLEDIYGHHCSCNPIAAAIAVIVQEVQSLTIVIMSSSEYWYVQAVTIHWAVKSKL